MPFARRQPRLHAGILLLFAVVTLAHTYPMWLTPGSVLNELWDVRLNAWTMAWDAHALITDPGSIFDANIFHPHANALAFSENLIGMAIVVAPINWLGHPVLAYNVALLLSFWLTGIATAYWVREITGRTDAGIVAGMAWSFAPVRFDHLPQLQLLAAPWFSLSLLALALYARTRKGRYLIGASLLLAWQYAAGVQLTLLLLPLAGIYAVQLALPRLADLANRRSAAHIVAAGVLFFAFTAPISLPYLEAREAEGFVRGLDEARAFSAQPVSLLSPSGLQKAGHMQALYRQYRRTESNFFPGFLLTGLAMLGFGVSARRTLATPRDDEAARRGISADRVTRLAFRVGSAIAAIGAADYLATLLLAQWWGRPEWATTALGLLTATHPTVVLFAGLLAATLTWRPSASLPTRTTWALLFSAVAVMCFLLASGPRPTAWNADLGTGPFQLMYDLLLPYRSIRAVGRFGMAMVLAIAVVAGVGYASLAARVAATRARRLALLLATVAALMFEVRVTPFPTVDARLDDAQVYEELARLPGRGAVVHIPMVPRGYPANVTEYMLGSTRHWRPLVNGFSGFLPPDLIELTLLDPMSEQFIARLEAEFAAEWIVVHGARVSDQLEQQMLAAPELELVRRWGDTLLFRLQPGPVRGGVITRRVAAWQLDRSDSLGFALRAGPGQPDMEVDLTIEGEALATLPATRGFEEFAISVPRPTPRAPNGTVTLAWRSRPAIEHSQPIGQTGAMIRRNVLVDAQESWLSLAIDDVFVRRVASAGILAVLLDEDPSPSPPTRYFEPTREGLQELARWASAQPAGSRVALAFRAESGEVLSGPSWSNLLNSVGSALAPDDFVVRGAVLGVVGAAPGTALEHFSNGRAWVRAGPSMDQYPRFALRHFRLSTESASREDRTAAAR